MSNLCQSSHPERSASQINFRKQSLCAKSKDPGGAYLTDAVRAFSTTEDTFNHYKRGNVPSDCQTLTERDEEIAAFGQ
jgi:hypothetical protein